MTSKRYHVWAGSDYYPGAGLEDYKGALCTFMEAKDHLLAEPAPYDWAVIADLSSFSDGELITVWHRFSDGYRIVNEMTEYGHYLEGIGEL